MTEFDPEHLREIAVELGVEDPDRIVHLFLELVAEEKNVTHLARPRNIIRRLEAHIDADLGVTQ